MAPAFGSTGDSPDGMEVMVRANGEGSFAKPLSSLPVGPDASGTGAGESPALPNSNPNLN